MLSIFQTAEFRVEGHSAMVGNSINEKLAVYGSLAPGEANHQELARLKGRWILGHVRGFLQAEGWGSGLGFPGLRLHKDGDVVPVQLFVSHDLPAHLARLDEFEGEDYERTVVSVQTDIGVVDAWIYAVHSRLLRSTDDA